MSNIPKLQQKHPDMPSISFDREGIRKLLHNINPAKAAGPDNLGARLLKEISSEIAPVYCHLFDQSYRSGSVPSSWTHALVCPIFKKAQRSNPANYRPVSLTAIPCKLLEHIVVSKTWQHVNKYNIISSKQFSSWHVV